MNREYLRAWHIFESEVPKIMPKFKQMVYENKDDLQGQL